MWQHFLEKGILEDQKWDDEVTFKMNLTVQRVLQRSGMFNVGFFISIMQSLVDSILIMTILFLTDREIDFFLLVSKRISHFRRNIMLSDVLYPKSKCRFLLPTNPSFILKCRGTYFIWLTRVKIPPLFHRIHAKQAL